MDDVITDAPPPSRFLLEDLNNFAPSPHPLPSPFLVFSSSDSSKNYNPSLLVIAISTPSLHFFHHISSKTLIGTLILPEIPLSGNTTQPSLHDRSCNIYSLNKFDESIFVALVQFSVSPERSHAVVKSLIGERIKPEKVLILDSVQSRNFRGKLSPDDTVAFKLETSVERQNLEDGMIKGLDYFPSGSVIDGLAAALLARCELMKIKGTLCISWPDLGTPVMQLLKCVLFRDVLSGVNYSMEGDFEDEYLKLSRRKGRMDSDLYT